MFDWYHIKVKLWMLWYGFTNAFRKLNDSELTEYLNNKEKGLK